MRTVFVAVFITVALASCAHRAHTRAVPPPPTVQPAYTETGTASWYGYPYHGRRAASGEIYDMEQMTAAHRTLPFNTKVRVFNLENGRTVEVRINDRGPFVANRVIDLSRAAARALAMLGPGSARVRLEVLRVGEEPTTYAVQVGTFAVQVGAFRDRNNAERIRRQMESRYGVARLVLRDGTPSLWRVLVGSEASEDAAAQLAARIRQDSDENTTAFVVRVDAA
jgi:rare lipoprotein A